MWTVVRNLGAYVATRTIPHRSVQLSSNHFRRSGKSINPTSAPNFWPVAWPSRVCAHEIGHALGLAHYDSAPAIMNSVAHASSSGPTQSDIDGILAIYGPSTATPISVATIQSEPFGDHANGAFLNNATTISNSINAGTTTETATSMAFWRRRQIRRLRPLRLKARVHGAVGSSAEVTLLAAQFLPPQGRPDKCKSWLQSSGLRAARRSWLNVRLQQRKRQHRVCEQFRPFSWRNAEHSSWRCRVRYSSFDSHFWNRVDRDCSLTPYRITRQTGKHSTPRTGFPALRTHRRSSRPSGARRGVGRRRGPCASK